MSSDHPLAWYDLLLNRAVASFKAENAESRVLGTEDADKTAALNLLPHIYENELYLTEFPEEYENQELEMPWVLVEDLAEPAWHHWALRKLGYPKEFSMRDYEEQGIPPTLIRRPTLESERVQQPDGRQVDWRQFPTKLWMMWR